MKKAVKGKLYSQWVTTSYRRRVLAYCLAFLLSLQSATVFSQQNTIFNHPYLSTKKETSQHSFTHRKNISEEIATNAQTSLERLQILEKYNENAPLLIAPGSFFLAPGIYSYPNHLPIAGQDYIPKTKLGNTIEYLLDPQRMHGEIYFLHNELIQEIETIKNREGSNTSNFLIEELKKRNIPSIEIEGIGVAEISQVDGRFLVRVAHQFTGTAFYILHESIESNSDHFLRLIGRQHYSAGRHRLDHTSTFDQRKERGRDIVFLWLDDSQNITKKVVIPRIEKKPLITNQQILPMYQQNPALLKETQKEHGRLHRRNYWNALRNPITMDDISFGASKMLWQAGIGGAVALLREIFTGQDVNVLAAMGVTACVTATCFFPSSYRYWLNNGPIGFIQKKATAKGYIDLEGIINDIDWKESLRSKEARVSVSNVLTAWAMLWVLAPEPTLWYFLWMQIIAIPNILLNNASRIAWTEQAIANAHAGTNQKELSVGPFKWSGQNFDHLFKYYFFYDLTRLFHLAGLGMLPVTVADAFLDVGVDLNTLGINYGLLSMYFSLLLGKFMLLKKVFKFQQENLLTDKQVWYYFDTILHNWTGRKLLSVEQFYSRGFLWWHKNHLQPENKQQLESMALFNSHHSNNVINNASTKEARHFQKWLQHAQRNFRVKQEASLYDIRKEINKLMLQLEEKIIASVDHPSEVDTSHESQASFFQAWIVQLESLFDQISHQLVRLPDTQIWAETELTYSAYDTNEKFHTEKRLLRQSEKLLNRQYYSRKTELITKAFRNQARTSFNNLTKVVQALFETLKIYYASKAPKAYRKEQNHTTLYSEIWKRNNNIESKNLLIVLEENVTSEFPHLKTALDIITGKTENLQQQTSQNITINSEVLLQELMNEINTFFNKEFHNERGEIEKKNLLALSSYIDDLADSTLRQEILNSNKPTMPTQQKINSHFNFNLNPYLEKFHASCPEALSR